MKRMYELLFLAVVLVVLPVSSAMDNLYKNSTISVNSSNDVKKSAEDPNGPTEIHDNMASEDNEPPEAYPTSGFDILLALLGFLAAIIVMDWRQ